MAGERHYLDSMTGHGPYRLEARSPRPPIVVISADMVPVEFHAGAGAARPRTPNLDALAAGLRFANAFATSPLCSPSRAAYLTGRHTYITTNSERAHDGHAVHLRTDDVIFPEYLKAAGYHVRHVGKCHAGAAKFVEVFGENDAPWDRWSPPWHDDDGYLAFLGRQGLARFDFEREICGRDLTGCQPGNSYGGWIAPQAGRPFPMEATYPAYLVERALEALAARDPDKPLYLQLDFFAPHQPFAIPGDMEGREAEIRAALSAQEGTGGRSSAPAGDSAGGTGGDNGAAGRGHGANPRVYDIYRRNWGLQDAQTVLDYRVANILQYEVIDTVLGRLLEALRNEGLYDVSWIFFLADHGEMNGQAALVDKGAYLHPRVLRVPLTIKPGCPPVSAARGDAGSATPGQTIRTPVSLLDLAPTVLELAGITTEARGDGVSLLRAAAGEARPADRPVMADVWSHVIPNPCVATLFTGDDGGPYLFVFNASDPVDELYRLADDGVDPPWPDNLIADVAQADLRAEAVRVLHARLAADERWKSYRGFLEITYPEILRAGGDRQLFV